MHVHIHIWPGLFDGTVQVAHAHGILAGLSRIGILRRQFWASQKLSRGFRFGAWGCLFRRDLCIFGVGP